MCLHFHFLFIPFQSLGCVSPGVEGEGTFDIALLGLVTLGALDCKIWKLRYFDTCPIR